MSDGRDDVAAGLGLHDRLPLQDRDGLVVGDIAVADHPVMAVRGERVERHVAQHAEIGERLFQRADGAAHEVVGVDRLAALPGPSAPGRPPGTPRSSGCRARRPRRRRRPAPAIDRRKASGIDGTGARPSSSCTNTGQIRSAAVEHAFGDELARPRIATVAAQPGRRIGRQRRQKGLGHGICPERRRMPANIRRSAARYNAALRLSVLHRSPGESGDSWSACGLLNGRSRLSLGLRICSPDTPRARMAYPLGNKQGGCDAGVPAAVRSAILDLHLSAGRPAERRRRC